jgi:stage II sporulation protein D
MNLRACQSGSLRVNFGSVRTREYPHKIRPYKVNGSENRTLFFIALALIFLSAGCGKPKVRAKAPLPRTTSTSSAKKPAPAKPPVARTPPVVKESPAPTVVAEPPTPAIAPVTVATEFIQSPSIRIGLNTNAKEIRISSSGNYSLMEKVPEAAQQQVRGEIQIRVEQEVEESSIVYRVQVASLSNEETAEDLKDKLTERYELPAIVRENPETGTNQVRVGEFQAKEDAQALLKRLKDSEYRGAFIVKESVSTGGGKLTLALRGSDDLFRLSQSGFIILPSSASSFLSLDGKPYRGLLDVFLNKNGKVTVVNQLGTEEYLLGVVPAEISPSSYPEFAGLAAQSIAARTYALFHMGQFRSDGFDLTNDTRTQVYGGFSIEKTATNEAVRQTAGLAIYYQNKVIDAMFMSTCGGRTEDFSNVFDAPEVPYLKSVFCAIESGPEKGVTILDGKHALDQPVLSEDGSVANRNLELARVLGMIEPGVEISPEFLAAPAKKDEVVRWVDNARKIAQTKHSDDPPAARETETRSGFLQFAAESFFGTGEIRRKISTRDKQYYMGNLKDGDAVPEPARDSLSYLMKTGLWRPNSDNTVRPDAPIRRSDALSILMNWVEFARPDILRKGTFVTGKAADAEGAVNSAITIKWGNRTQVFSLSENPYLFRLDTGRTTPVSSLKIIGNEKVSFHLSPSGSIDFLEIELSPNGASSDRYSPVASWDTKIDRATVADKLRSLTGNIGQLRDLQPAKIGNSGRAVQIQAIGSRSSVVIKGYNARNALGLRDIPLTFTREYNPDGSIASFIFHGRGWGHGVGLCQVGAFGMARDGHSYEEILKTYYQGVEIKKAY